MKERLEKVIELGLVKKSENVIDEIEKTAKRMKQKGWTFLNSKTDLNLNSIILTFEKKINN